MLRALVCDRNNSFDQPDQSPIKQTLSHRLRRLSLSLSLLDILLSASSLTTTATLLRLFFLFSWRQYFSLTRACSSTLRFLSSSVSYLSRSPFHRTPLKYQLQPAPVPELYLPVSNVTPSAKLIKKQKKRKQENRKTEEK